MSKEAFRIIAYSAFTTVLVLSIVSGIWKKRIRRYQWIISLIQNLGLIVGFAAYLCLITTA